MNKRSKRKRSPNIPDRFAALDARMERTERAIVLRERLSHGSDQWCEPIEMRAKWSMELQATLYAIRCDLADREKESSK